MTPIDLTRANLPHLPPTVRTPAYPQPTPGILHLGLGGFHRAHMARYTHELMERDPAARAFGIVGTTLRRGDNAIIDALTPQDALYTLLERSGEAETATVIGSLAGLLYGGEDSTPLIAAGANPSTRIVSLTVTENGYCLNPATKRLDPNHPLVAADLAHPRQPASAIGVIVEILRRRRRGSDGPPPTLLTCDNIQHNGQVLRAAVLDLATMLDPDLAAWIGDKVAFPSTMVDRITPVTTDADREYLLATYGLRDRWPVVAETFSQWIIEDHFTAGRPAWEEVGAQFVADVAPYEAMKLRLLNGSHLAVAALGRLQGLRYIHETMADPALRAYMQALMDREAGPTLPEVPGIDLDDYKRTLIERFANPAIRDTVERVNTDAPLNVLLDPIRARLATDETVDLLALALAAWMRRIRGIDEEGKPIDIRHPLASLLRERAEAGGSDPAPLLAIEPLFGDLAHDKRLLSPLRHFLAALYAHGSRATLQQAREQLTF